MHPSYDLQTFAGKQYGSTLRLWLFLLLRSAWPSWAGATLLDFSPWSNRSRMSVTILLIDDNAIQASTRQAILRRAGYSAIAVLNPRQALEQLRDGSSSDIRLVITDHIMPGMNGSEFVRQLRQTHPTLPVLVISGLEDAEAEYEGLNVLFRLKPLQPENLLASVQGLVEQRG